MKPFTFKREAGWLLLLVVGIPALAILFAIALPALARLFHSAF